MDAILAPRICGEAWRRKIGRVGFPRGAVDLPHPSRLEESSCEKKAKNKFELTLEVLLRRGESLMDVTTSPGLPRGFVFASPHFTPAR